jgi:hypothetical protein
MQWIEQDNVYNEIYVQVKRVIMGRGRHWLFCDKIDADPYEQYVEHFNKLVNHKLEKNTAPVVEARLAFVDGDLHGRLINDKFLREDGMKADLATTATAILWHSRGRATRSGNINDHIKTKTLVSAAPLNAIASPSTIQNWLTDQINSGKVVSGRDTGKDARQKWLSLSVDSAAKQWIRRLTWYLVRTIVHYQNTKIEEHRYFWAHTLYMPVEVFDHAENLCKSLTRFTMDNLYSDQQMKADAAKKAKSFYLQMVQ